MDLLDRTLPELDANLALDEALLLEAEAGQAGEILRLWEWPQLAVILGSGGSPSDDVLEDACRDRQVPIHRRASGGGTVLVGSGCLCFSLVLNTGGERMGSITASYQIILERTCKALAPEIDAVRMGISDLACQGRKFSGNAQQRKRAYFLHQGTLLHQFDLSRVGQFLKLPPRRPEYRGQREHAAFLANLPVSAAWLRERIRLAWHAGPERRDLPLHRVEQLVADKYRQPEWLYRRS